MLWVALNMGMSAARCQGNVGEFQIVYRVVTVYFTVYVCAAEMRQLEVRDWFGQGGSGAPIRDANGNIITDYNSRHVTLLLVMLRCAILCSVGPKFTWPKL